jgi:diguanylate cyclase (GGDEF)-like protein
MMGTRRSAVVRAAVAVAVFLAGLGATVDARQVSVDRDRRSEVRAFNAAAGRVQGRLQSELGRFEDLLLATAGTVLHGTNEAGFRAFARSIDLTHRYPGAVALAYVERDPGPPETAKVRLVEPPPPFEVTGADILRLPEAREALAQAAAGRVTMTPRLASLEPALSIQSEHGALFSLFAPVGDKEHPLGWVGLPLMARDFSSWLARGGASFIDVAIYDGPVVNGTRRLTPPPAGRTLRRRVSQVDVYGSAWTLEVRQVGRAGDAPPIGTVTGLGLGAALIAALAVWVLLAARERRRQFVHDLAYRAAHDELTGLPNRQELRAWLTRELAPTDVPTLMVALLYCDLDRFKVANDSLGHTVGDELLVRVADRFRAVVRERDIVARLGGDEFGIGCHVANEREATRLAERLRAILTEPFNVGGSEVFLTVSVGVALTPPGEVDVEQLVADADTAMYRAKTAGRGVSSASRGHRQAVRDRLDIEGALHHATKRDGLRLHYQPVVDMASGRTVGCEALVRWQHPTLGLVGPERFIDVAEETGLIVDIGAWVIETACKAWARSGRMLPSLSVNLSARQLSEPDLGRWLADVLRSCGMPPHVLTLEITETVLASPAVAEEADELRALGVRVAVDDFGTGYSSLASLRHLPVDVLKIDQRFVAGMGADAVDDAIVEAVVVLARTLNLELIAEGVETEAQAFALRAAGCHLAQGFLFGRPSPALPELEVAAAED